MITEVKVRKAKEKEKDKAKAKEKAKARVKALRGGEREHNPQHVQQNAVTGTKMSASSATTVVMITHQTAKIGSTDGVSGTKNEDLDTNQV